MSKRVSTPLGWIEAHEARRLSEQAILTRKDSEREEPAREDRAREDAARGLAALMRAIGLWLAQTGEALRGRRGRTAARLLLFGFLAGVGAVGASPAPGWAQAEEQTVVVALKHHQFEPQVVRVRPGQTIRFDNADDTLHILTLLGREDVIGEVPVDPGTSYTARVPSNMPTGNYELACTIHVEMRGVLSVAGR